MASNILPPHEDAPRTTSEELTGDELAKAAGGTAAGGSISSASPRPRRNPAVINHEEQY